MGQDPNQPYSGPYGQQPDSGYQGYQQQPPSGYQQPPSGYQQPPSGYQQPPSGGYQYQQQGVPPYGQAPLYNVGHPNGATSINLDPKTAAGLSYLGAWVTGLIFFFIEKENRFVRFHAMQSILAFGAYTVLNIIINVVQSALYNYVPVLGCVTGPVLWLAFLAIWIFCMVNAFQGKYIKLPVIGDYAEKYSTPAPKAPGM